MNVCQLPLRCVSTKLSTFVLLVFFALSLTNASADNSDSTEDELSIDEDSCESYDCLDYSDIPIEPTMADYIAMTTVLSFPESPCSQWSLCDVRASHRLSQFRDTSVDIYRMGTLQMGGASKRVDDKALRAQYSFKYSFTDLECDYQRQNKGQLSRQYLDCLSAGSSSHQSASTFDFFLAMSGVFDFYAWGGRFSQPVVNRVSNPGLYFSWQRPFNMWVDAPEKTAIIGLEHRSDGQAVDQYDSNGDAIVDVISDTLAAYNSNDQAYMDSLSQGANYISFHYDMDYLKLGSSRAKTNVGFFGEFKYYLSDNGRQSWNAGKELIGFEGYDMVTVGLNARFGIPLGKILKPIRTDLHLQYRLGSQLMEGDSFDSRLTMDLCFFDIALPLQITYHNGAMDNLAQYSTDSVNFGIGLNLTNLGSDVGCKLKL